MSKIRKKFAIQASPSPREKKDHYLSKIQDSLQSPKKTTKNGLKYSENKKVSHTKKHYLNKNNWVAKSKTSKAVSYRTLAGSQTDMKYTVRQRFVVLTGKDNFSTTKTQVCMKRSMIITEKSKRNRGKDAMEFRQSLKKTTSMSKSMNVSKVSLNSPGSERDIFESTPPTSPWKLTNRDWVSVNHVSMSDIKAIDAHHHVHSGGQHRTQPRQLASTSKIKQNHFGSNR